MKFIRIFLLNTLLMVLAMTNVNATHVMGGDLTYECTNNPGEYEFKFTFVRDCRGQVQAPTSVYLNLNSSCGKSVVELFPTNADDITPLCNNQTSVCAGGGIAYGVERYRYTAKRQFTPAEANCTNWTAEVSVAARNAAITTVDVDPLSTSMTIEHDISSPFENTFCNNSPVFTNEPNVFACANQQTFYNHGVTDIDGDDLVFSLINCKDGDVDVLYIPPYNGTNPITGNFSIDPHTGQIEFTATAQQVAIFCVLVQEYRNGTLIGEVVRDIQLTVYDCNNNIPEVTGVNGSTDYTITSSLCSNQVCFNIYGSDPDPGDNVTLSWNFAIPNASFGIYNNGSTMPEGVVCYIPSDLGLGNHTFTVTMEDDHCPLVGQNTLTYEINIIDTENGNVDFFPYGCLNNLSCTASGFSLQAFPEGVGSGNQTYQWTSNVDSDPTKFAVWICDPGTYEVVINDEGCIFNGEFILPDIDYDVYPAGPGFTCANGEPTGGYSLNASENLSDDYPDVVPISYQWTATNATIDPIDQNKHAIWVIPDDIISYPVTYEVVTTTNLGEVCGSYTIYDPECQISCCEFGEAGFLLDIETSVDNYALIVKDFEPYAAFDAEHEWSVLCSPNPNSGPYTQVSIGYTNGPGPHTIYNSADYGLYYYVTHKVISDCGEACYAITQYQDTFLVALDGGEATVAEVDCSLLACILTKPTFLTNVDNKLQWKAVPGAVSYTVSFNPDIPSFCNCDKHVKHKDVHTTNTSITVSSKFECFVWKVTAICADGTAVTSDPACYSKSNGPVIGGGKDGNFDNPFDENLSNSPNPFNDVTTIEFKLETDTKVKLFVTDVSGKQVASILDNEKVSSGIHQVNFDGSSLSSGIYFYTIETDQFTVSKRMILSK